MPTRPTPYASYPVLVRPGIVGCIMPRLAYRDRPVPKGFDRDEVEKLLATTEGSTLADCRDCAGLMIPATCGPGAGEVDALWAEDIDWERDLRTFPEGRAAHGDELRDCRA